MTQTSQDNISAAGQAFAQNLAAFHAGLPAEQQALLEQLVALAERATNPAAETAGFVLGGPAGRPTETAAVQDLSRLLTNGFSFVIRVNKASPML